LRNPLRCFFLSGRFPRTIRPLAKPFLRFILHRASHLEKRDHLRNPSRCFFLSGKSPRTIRPLWNPFRVLFFILQVTWKNETTHEILRVASSYQVGCLKQLDHSRNPFRVLFFIGLSRFILHRAGCLEKWDHSRNPSRLFFLSGRSPGTIRPLAKLFSRFILHRQVTSKNETTREILRVAFSYQAGHLEQLDHLKKTKKKSIKKKRKKEKRKGFHNYSSLQNLLYKVKRKLIF